ncbi:ATP-binding cassette domain-containing protein [Corynebacterium freiburgense]|uniref:ATP-binding cassette domain-containing protein n=1 Tax=Corynebacterium freiburgense TaxID=556548 RepID=UPI000418B5D2|nr:ATP-binding cassette domain-containing protein [Corynebacterium freiburgense]WJZ03424.1 Putative ABC transporter ATP-binding protein AlbC [Corynebacterium freiburgense]
MFDSQHVLQLAAKDIEVWYKPDEVIAKAAQLDIPKGNVIGLLGGNGAGKTTLIKGLSGILPGWKCSSFNAGGTESSPGARAFKQMRYTVFADDRSFFAWNFRQYLEYVCGVYGLEVDEGLVAHLVAGFNFEPHIQKQLRNLSSGNNKKARLICAFAIARPLLILDEPVDFLDFVGTEFLYECITQYAMNGNSVFLSSHIAESFTRCCDYLYVLKEGSLSGLLDVPREAEDVIKLVSQNS